MGFQCYTDIENPILQKQMNIAKVAEIISWGFVNLVNTRLYATCVIVPRITTQNATKANGLNVFSTGVIAVIIEAMMQMQNGLGKNGHIFAVLRLLYLP